MPRCRTTAIAALAVSALLATSGAAYAHDFGLRKTAGEAREAPSMSWGYFHGDLTDIWADDDVFDGARATAVMVGINNEATFRVTIKGLENKAIDHDYGAHLHMGKCGTDPVTRQSTVGVHYNISEPDPVTKLPTVVSDKTEVWLNFHVNSDGDARATATVPFVPEGTRSITFHALPTVKKQTESSGPKVGFAGDKLACLPLDIKKLSSTG
jgi:hypothetical protein